MQSQGRTHLVASGNQNGCQSVAGASSEAKISVQPADLDSTPQRGARGLIPSNAVTQRAAFVGNQTKDPGSDSLV
jgi:hypothetical protein